METPLSMENQIVAAIRRIMRAVDLHSRRLAEEHGLTGPQLATLQAAASLGESSTGTLARAVHLSGPTVTGRTGEAFQSASLVVGKMSWRRLPRSCKTGSDRS